MCRVTSGLYYKSMMIVNDGARVINKLEASLTDDARVAIYDRHMFILQATEAQKIEKIFAHFLKSSPKNPKSKKCLNIYTEAQFESPKHLYQNTFETLKYLEQTIFKSSPKCCHFSGLLHLFNT
jgi:hypothetical protein